MQKKTYEKISFAEMFTVLAVAAGTALVFFAVQLNIVGLVWASYTSSSNVIANANVLTICFTSLSPNGIPLNQQNPLTVSNTQNDLIFGTNAFGGTGNGLSPGNFNPTDVVLVDNDVGGNAAAYIYLAGGNWYQGSNTANSFGVTNTFWNPSTNTFAQPTSANANALTLYTGLASMVDTQILVPAPVNPAPNVGNTANVYFGITIPLNVGLGIYTENIVVENAC